MAKHDGTYVSHATSKRVSKAWRAKAVLRRHRTAQRKLDRALTAEGAAADGAAGRGTSHPVAGRSIAASPPVANPQIGKRRVVKGTGMPRLNVRVKEGYFGPVRVAELEFTSEAREVDVDDATAAMLRADDALEVVALSSRPRL